MNNVIINDLNLFVELGAVIYKAEHFLKINNISPIEEADENTLIFIDTNLKEKSKLLKTTFAKTVICDKETYTNNNYLSKCFIVTINPKLLFVRVIKQIVKKENIVGIDKTAVVHKSAIVSQSVYIGAGCYIGNCEIGEGSIIHPNCTIYDNVKIGKNVVIDSGAVVGAAGFGFVRDEDGVPHRFPQLGRVIIEDDVEIGANTCIDRGALKDTIIHKGVKIDNLVHIAHNVEIGAYSYIIAMSVISGSVTIGEKCWISPSFIINKVNIGNNVTVGFGANVLKSVKDNKTVLGNPAMSLDKYIDIQYTLRNRYNVRLY